MREKTIAITLSENLLNGEACWMCAQRESYCSLMVPVIVAASMPSYHKNFCAYDTTPDAYSEDLSEKSHMQMRNPTNVFSCAF